MQRCVTALLVTLLGVTAAGNVTQIEPAGLLATVDHLVYATPELQVGIDRVENVLGVRATPGVSTLDAEPETLWSHLGRQPTWRSSAPIRNSRPRPSRVHSGSMASRNRGSWPGQPRGRHSNNWPVKRDVAVSDLGR